MRKKICKSILCLLACLALAQPAQAKNEVFAYVVIWDVAPAQAKSFEASLLHSGQAMTNESGFITERILKNIDPLTYHYATYTKSKDRSALESRMRQRMADLRRYLRRDPESHLAQVTSSFTPKEESDHPKGREFGMGKLGQIAHLGLFIPYPEFREEYDRTLRRVKVVTRNRRPEGYLGDELLVETELIDPAQQTPYSPRAFEPSKMSINYGEYDTLEDAENSYIKRGADRPTNPVYLGLERIFYSALQVPTRFYIFSVIGNVDGRDQRAENVEPEMKAGS
jgi:hypothetical protein